MLREADRRMRRRKGWRRRITSKKRGSHGRRLTKKEQMKRVEKEQNENENENKKRVIGGWRLRQHM